jgi:hypothetical protein
MKKRTIVSCARGTRFIQTTRNPKTVCGDRKKHDPRPCARCDHCQSLRQISLLLNHRGIARWTRFAPVKLKLDEFVILALKILVRPRTALLREQRCGDEAPEESD